MPAGSLLSYENSLSGQTKHHRLRQQTISVKIRNRNIILQNCPGFEPANSKTHLCYIQSAYISVRAIFLWGSSHVAGTDVSLVLFLSEKNAFKTLENIIRSTVTCVPSHVQRTHSA